MKLFKAASALLMVIALILITVLSARTEWLSFEEPEAIVIIRIDNLPGAPYHQIDHGVYATYNAQHVLVTALDLNRSNPGPVAPYILADFLWVPGPMDAPS